MSLAKPTPPTQSQEQVNKSRYRPEIDGLRAFAVIAVIINHINRNLLPSGYLGVDVFFVISGYVITLSLSNRVYGDFWAYIKDFYCRRIQRIYPALICVIALTIICTFFVVPEPQIHARTAISAILGVSNIYLWQGETGYFSELSELNPFTHTWSLGVEGQFYFIFPIICWLVGFISPHAPASGLKIKANRLLLGLLPLAAASLVMFVYVYPINQSTAYFLMPFRFWELAFGGIIRALEQESLFAKPRNEGFYAEISLAVLAITLFFPVSAAVPATVTCVLASGTLLLLIRAKSPAKSLLDNKLSSHIGKISYSLYLVHWSVLSIARWTVGVNQTTVAPLLIVIYLCSLVNYTWIEVPFRRIRFARKNLIFSLWFTAILACSSLIYIIQRLDILIYRNLYIGSREGSAPIAAMKDNKIFIIGDSYARDIFTYLIKGNESRVVPYLMGGCSFFDASTKVYSKCSVHKKNWGDILKFSRAGDVVIAISAAPHSITDITRIPRDPTAISTDEDKMTRFLEEVLPVLQKKGVRLLIRIPFPSWKITEINGYLCQREWFRPSLPTFCQSNLSDNNLLELKGVDLNHSRKLVDLSIDYPNLILIDYFEFACDKNDCLPFKSGISKTYDGGHLYRWSPQLSMRFRAYLNKLLMNYKELSSSGSF